MSRFAVILCALGLSARAAVAQELRLDPPQLSAREHCGAQQRALCEGRGQRALDSGLSCDACGVPPMPADVVAPATPTATEKRTTSPECLPRAAGPLPSSCVKAPRIDTIPRW